MKENVKLKRGTSILMVILASLRTSPSLELKYYTRLKGALVFPYASIREIRQGHKR